MNTAAAMATRDLAGTIVPYTDPGTHWMTRESTMFPMTTTVQAVVDPITQALDTVLSPPPEPV